MEMAFFVIINELLRDKASQFGIPYIAFIRPAPQTQTATAHLQTT